MKINKQFQDLHTPGGGDIDWCTIQMFERDICLLYHQLADYSYIMGDLYYGDVFSLPYWEYLNLKALEDDRQRFIRNGCLIILYAMASEVLDGSGAYLTMDRDRYQAAKSALKDLPSFDPDTNLLIDAVKNSFKLIDEKRGSWEETPEVQEVIAASSWIHEKFIRQYFIERSNEFESNPYYQGIEPM